MTFCHSLPNQGGTTKRMKPSSLTVMGGGGFFYLRLLNKLPLQRSRSFDPFDVLRGMRRGCPLCGLARGMARLGAPGIGG